MATFFSETVITNRKPLSVIAQCGRCGYYKSCKFPKQKVAGKGKKGILIIGSFPGKDEVTPFSDSDGRYLKQTLDTFGIEMLEDCWLTNALICHPSNIKISQAVDFCRPNIIRTIKELKPKVIILLGQLAVKSVIGHCWGVAPGELDRWVGWRIPDQTTNAWICPTWGIKRVLEDTKKYPMILKLWKEHLKSATDIMGLIFGQPKTKKYKEDVQVIAEEGLAVRRIEQLAACYPDYPFVTFDYETNMLKPDSDRSRIICFSISNGTWTVACPFTRRTSRELVKILADKRFKKIGANIKFEHRWTRKHLGINVRNWDIDVVLTSHTLDNRSGINSVEFQAYVRLGQPEWASVVHPYLTGGDSGQSENRIKEVNMEDLLLYCGMDSLVEWKLAEVMRKELV